MNAWDNITGYLQSREDSPWRRVGISADRYWRFDTVSFGGLRMTRMVDYFTYFGPSQSTPLFAWINSTPWIHNMNLLQRDKFASLHLLTLFGSMRDIAQLTSTCTSLLHLRDVWCASCHRNTFSPRRTVFMGRWDWRWNPDPWWSPVQIARHLDDGDGHGESMLCFSCWALYNWSDSPGSDRAFFRIHDEYTDLDREETAALRGLAPETRSPDGDETPYYDERVRVHSAMVGRRHNRSLQHACFVRRWFF